MQALSISCCRLFRRLIATGGKLYAFCIAPNRVRAAMADVAPDDEHAVSSEQALMLAVDTVFLFVGIVYGSRVLSPKPMTYLSEIAFPLDGMSSGILWMEYRRGLTPSAYLRIFWLVKWLDATYFLVVYRQFAAASNHSSNDISHATAMVFGGVCYAASAILVVFLFFTPTPVTPECISYPTEIRTPSAYLYSSHRRPPTSFYGSFRELELVSTAHNTPFLPDNMPT
ncbi:hypothetical protein BBJ28_00015374 [Nothophytophthora sp. Chile5]|nr:hypothetical protein BBJ28_00015374 [Nothophytophthora sp. Chile5]